MGRSFVFLSLMLALSFMIAAQGNTSRLGGIITDPQGGIVVNAQVTVTNIDTHAIVITSSNEHGEWVVPGMSAGNYRISINHPGFKSKVVENVVINSGVPANVNVGLEVGAVTETVEVSAGVDVLQTTTAAVNSTVTASQVANLPFASRNSVELLVSQPGTQTPGTPRPSTINGL